MSYNAWSGEEGIGAATSLIFLVCFFLENWEGEGPYLNALLKPSLFTMQAGAQTHATKKKEKKTKYSTQRCQHE
jgi:hypothetical protein